MPRIPLYNQGLGPSVEMATGQLSPRASAQAMAAPGQAMAGLGRVIQQTAQVGAKFEMERQQREAEDVKLSIDKRLMQQASDLNRDGSLRDVDSYRSAFDGLQTQLFSDVDAMQKLNAGQKRAIKRSLTAKANVLRASGAEQAHGFYLQDATAEFNENADATLSMSRTDSSLNELLSSEYAEKYSQARQRGLSPAMTPDQYTLEIYRQTVSDFSRDEAQNLTELKQLQQKILNGDDEYGQFLQAERNLLANELTQRINFLSDEGVFQAQSAAKDAMTSLVFSTDPNEQKELAGAVSDSIASLASLGALEQAAELDMQLSGTLAAVEAGSRTIFGNQVAINDELKNARLRTEDAKGTDRADETAFAEKQIQELFAAREKAKQEDVAQYVASNYLRIYGVEPTQAQILEKQRLMGIPEKERKVLTKSQVTNTIERINQAENPTEVNAILSSLYESDTMMPTVMRQMVGSGLPLAVNYAANLPSSPSASMLLNSARPGAIKINVSSTAKDLVRSAVLQNEIMQNQLKSSLGGSYTDFNNNNIVGSASDNPAMNQSRASHVEMVQNFAIYLAQEAGEVFSGKDAIDRGGIEDYVEKAVTIFSERYDYITSFENDQTALRIPAWLAPQKGKITYYLKKTVSDMLEREIYYKNPALPDDDPRQNLQKIDYVNGIKDGYGWVASQDGKSALLVDDTGGLVFKSELVAGVIQVVPFSVPFNDAISDYEGLKQQEQEERSAELKQRARGGGVRAGAK